VNGVVPVAPLTLSDFVVEPPDGATFALPHSDIPDRFREHVLASLYAAKWNRYYQIPAAVVETAIFGGGAPKLCSTSFFRGAEGALLALALQMRPDRIWAPFDSYPGYQRVADAVDAKLCGYSVDTIPKPHPADERSWLIVTVPGNPRDNFVMPEEWARWRNGSPRIIVDATYEMPGTRRFTELVTVALDAGACVVFSFSKALPLAGLRLGGCILPQGIQQPPGPHHQWSILDVAVIAAMSDVDVAGWMSSHREAQLKVHRRLIEELSGRGHQISGQESGVFVTTQDKIELGVMTGKRYASGIVRLDSSPENISSLIDIHGQGRG